MFPPVRLRSTAHIRDIPKAALMVLGVNPIRSSHSAHAPGQRVSRQVDLPVPPMTTLDPVQRTTVADDPLGGPVGQMSNTR
jgi:hypothetical protein